MLWGRQQNKRRSIATIYSVKAFAFVSTGCNASFPKHDNLVWSEQFCLFGNRQFETNRECCFVFVEMSKVVSNNVSDGPQSARLNQVPWLPIAIRIRMQSDNRTDKATGFSCASIGHCASIRVHPATLVPGTIADFQVCTYCPWRIAYRYHYNQRVRSNCITKTIVRLVSGSGVRCLCLSHTGFYRPNRTSAAWQTP